MKTKYIIYLCTITLCIVFLSCKAKNQLDTSTIKTSSEYIDELIQQNFESESIIEKIPNSQNSLILCISKSIDSAKNPIPDIKFFVFNNESSKIIYQNKFANSEISWYNNDELLLKKYLGTIQNYISSGYTLLKINIKTKKIIEINNSKINKP